MNFDRITENLTHITNIMTPIFYKKVDTEDGELLLPATPSDLDYLPIQPKQQPKLQAQPKPQPSQKLPQVLTHQLYLDVRRRDQEQNSRCFDYLNFTDKTYFEHFSSSMSRSWICTKSSFYFFIQSFYPDVFQHRGNDMIVELSEDILDEYATAINNKVDSLV
jgi:hypothetical protein